MFGGFYLEGVWLWRISGSYSQEMMWLVLVNYLAKISYFSNLYYLDGSGYSLYVTPNRVFWWSIEVLEVQDVPSEEVWMVPDSPTVMNELFA